MEVYSLPFTRSSKHIKDSFLQQLALRVNTEGNPVMNKLQIIIFKPSGRPRDEFENLIEVFKDEGGRLDKDIIFITAMKVGGCKFEVPSVFMSVLQTSVYLTDENKLDPKSDDALGHIADLLIHKYGFQTAGNNSEEVTLPQQGSMLELIEKMSNTLNVVVKRLDTVILVVKELPDHLPNSRSADENDKMKDNQHSDNEREDPAVETTEMKNKTAGNNSEEVTLPQQGPMLELFEKMSNTLNVVVKRLDTVILVVKELPDHLPNSRSSDENDKMKDNQHSDNEREDPAVETIQMKNKSLDGLQQYDEQKALVNPELKERKQGPKNPRLMITGDTSSQISDRQDVDVPTSSDLDHHDDTIDTSA